MEIGPSDNKGEEKGSKGKDHMAQKEKEKTHGKATHGKSKMRKEKEEARGMARAKEKEGQRKVRRERQTCRKSSCRQAVPQMGNGNRPSS